jgi:hypothetical protein
MRLKTSHKPNTGASLLEVLIASFMIAGVVAVISIFFPKAIGSNINVRRRWVASGLAASKMREIKSIVYARIPLTPREAFSAGKACDCSAQVLSPTVFPDDDKGNPWTDDTLTPPVSEGDTVVSGGVVYSRQVCVARAEQAAPWIFYCGDDAHDETGLKYIRVVVSWDAGTERRSVAMESLASL